MKPWRVTQKEARELVRADKELGRKGGSPHAEVVREMLADMETDLRRMVREYDGAAARSRALLEGLVIAEAEGVPKAVCADIRRELAERVRKRRAA